MHGFRRFVSSSITGFLSLCCVEDIGISLHQLDPSNPSPVSQVRVVSNPEVATRQAKGEKDDTYVYIPEQVWYPRVVVIGSPG